MSEKYDIIYADPPWRYESGTTMKKWSIEEHYDTMSVGDISNLSKEVKGLAAPDCVLFLWATAPLLPEALTVLSSWGFKYRTHCIWDKKLMGMGHWFRGRHELLLLGVRGKPKTPDDSLLEESVIELTRGKHSEKPDYFRGIIERYFPKAKKIEMFARDKVPGWDVWGRDAPKHNTTLF